MSTVLTRSYPDQLDTSSGDAVAADILSGKKAWVDGSEVTGTAHLREAVVDAVLSLDNTASSVGSRGTYYCVETAAGVRYHIYCDNNSDLVFKKSSDGINWSVPTAIYTGTLQNGQWSVWYDRWSGIAAGLIHCAYTETVNHDTLYRSIDTENADLLGTETTIFAGTSAASGGEISIVRTRGGNLLCRTVIDAGVEGGVYKSTDVGATWGAVTVNEALSSTDQAIFMPGFAADNQDAILIFWDASANEISRQLYDDSANTWSETSIAASMTELVPNGGALPNFSACVDLTNSRIILAAWENTDTASAKLRCWTITESAITEKTNIVSSSTDDQGLCAIALATDTGYWHAFYGGKTDGSNTWNTDMDICHKVSTDQGTTWGSEEQINGALPLSSLQVLTSCPRFTGPWQIMYRVTNANILTGAYTLFFARGA